MQLRRGLRFLLVAIACSASFATQAGVVWNEASSADLSNDGLSPTSLLIGTGSNIVLGITGNTGQGIDRDYFSITVPSGSELTSIMLLPNTFVSGGSSFIGIQNGPQLTVSPEGVGAENLLGFAHYSNDQIGTDLLPIIHIVPATIGFSSALSSGTYSVWVQETGGPAAYGLDFVVTPVPLPGAAILLMSGLLGLATFRKHGRDTGKLEPV